VIDEMVDIVGLEIVEYRYGYRAIGDRGKKSY
jgi:hypothetical protein